MGIRHKKRVHLCKSLHHSKEEQILLEELNEIERILDDVQIKRINLDEGKIHTVLQQFEEICKRYEIKGLLVL